ncbi:MAG: slipin family protein [Candidatus Fermentibacteraceae bacterium]|nr:slipin family protein [Candidatus Fermentibacteraceae bacterium]MBN2609104.1 slipin family protein [Candidatus Fermentibacteraceae bacterium]
MGPGIIVVLVILFIFLLSALKVLKEYQRGVIFRLGKVIGLKGPGLIIVWPMIDNIRRVDLRVVTMDVPPQDIITRDNVSVRVNAVVYFRVVDPRSAILEVENYIYATSQLAQTTLRSVLGEASLDQLLSQRDEINAKLQDILDRMTDPWGIKVSTVEVKHVDLPEDMQRVMARQAEAERDRRAKIIRSDAEFQAAQKLADAADIIDAHPVALQLRYMQTLSEIAVENNSTTIFPLPIELLKPFLRKLEDGQG